MTHILCIGEAMAEISHDGADFRVGFAGDTLNTAIYLQRGLGQAGRVGYVTRIGPDPLSHRLVGFIRSEGVGTDLIETDPVRNLGIYSITVDPAGERSFHYWRNASAARAMFDGAGGAQSDGLATADVVYLSGISIAILSVAGRAQLLNRLTALRRDGVRVAFDSNYRPKLWEDAATAREIVTAFWRISDIALPSVDDEMALYGDADAAAVLARLHGFGCTAGALKQGGSGPLPIGAEVGDIDYPRAEVVVDSTAAGDSFNGGFLAAHVQGQSLAEAMMAGHDTARRVVGQRGAIIPRD